VLNGKMCGTIFLNLSMRKVRIARMVCSELNIVRGLRFRRGYCIYTPPEEECEHDVLSKRVPKTNICTFV